MKWELLNSKSNGIILFFLNHNIILHIKYVLQIHSHISSDFSITLPIYMVKTSFKGWDLSITVCSRHCQPVCCRYSFHDERGLISKGRRKYPTAIMHADRIWILLDDKIIGRNEISKTNIGLTTWSQCMGRLWLRRAWTVATASGEDDRHASLLRRRDRVSLNFSLI